MSPCNNRNTSTLFSFTCQFLSSSAGALIRSFLSHLSSFQSSYHNDIFNTKFYNSGSATEKDHMRFIGIVAFSIRFFLALPDGQKRTLGPASSILSSYLNTDDLSKYIFKRLMSYADEKQFVLLHSSVDCLSAVLFLIDFTLSKGRLKSAHKGNVDKHSELIVASADSILCNFFYDFGHISSIALLSKSITYTKSRGFACLHLLLVFSSVWLSLTI